MRADEKQLEGSDLDREETHTRQRGLEAEDDLELRELVGEQVLDAEEQYADSLISAVVAILENRNVQVAELALPARELAALDALQHAVTGRSAQGTFVFANDRSQLLETALAVLQPNLTNLDPAKLAELEGGFAGLVERVGDLRAALSNLEDAQDELLDASLQLPDLTKESTDPVDAPKPPSTLSSGPPRPDQQPPPSTLDGPARPEPPKTSSLYEDPKK